MFHELRIGGRRLDEDRLHRRGAGGALFRDPDEEAGSAHAITVFERNRPTTRSAGASCSPTRRSRTSPGPTRRARPRSIALASPIGTTSTSTSTARDHLVRPRLQRHRPQAAAQHPAAARAEAWACAACSRPRSRASTRLLGAADLIVAADGVNSRIRDRYAAHFGPEIDGAGAATSGSARSRRSTPSRSSSSETERGWFQAHAYRFDDDASTFIVETPEEVWRAAGLDGMSQRRERSRSASALFADVLDGHRLMTNALRLRGSPGSTSRASPTRSWVKDNLVLMGDAAHTAHFSIGSGTKLALEDAIALARRARASSGRDLAAALAAYEAERKVEVLQAAERGAQLDRMVRERRALRQAASPSSSPMRCSPAASASATRTCGCATRTGSRASSAGSRQRASGRAAQQRGRRRCSRPSGCAAWSSPTAIVVSPMAMYSRRRRRAGRSSTWSTSARAPRAAPGWSSPR